MPKCIESELILKATADLNESVNQDLLKADGNLKELLDDRSPETIENNSDRSS